MPRWIISRSCSLREALQVRKEVFLSCLLHLPEGNCAHAYCVLRYKCTPYCVSVCVGWGTAVSASWVEISFTTSMKTAQIHSRAHRPILPRGFNPYYCLMSIKAPENGIWQAHARTLGNEMQFSSGWTIIHRSYLCSSLAPSSWAGRRRCLTQGDRCRVLSTAPDRLAVGHHNSLLSSLQSTRTPRAHIRRGRRTGGPHSPLQVGGEEMSQSLGWSEVGKAGEGAPL